MESNYYWQANGTDNNITTFPVNSIPQQQNKYIQPTNVSQEPSQTLQSQSSPANERISQSPLYTSVEGANDGSSSSASEPVMPIEISNPDAIEPKARSYTCRICQMTFPNKSAVTVHSRLHTDHQGKPFKCSFCDKGFSTNFYLKQHERIHSGQKPYKCPMCEQSFKQLSHVQQHVRTHTGVRPYKCHWPGCGKAFLQQSHLKSHEARHTPKTSTGEKPYKCHWPDCGKSFAQLTNLKSHVARHGKGRKRGVGGNVKKSEEGQNQNSSINLSLQDVINQAAAVAEIVPVVDVREEAEIRPFLCPGCSKVYVREATFKKHLEECKQKLKMSISATATALGIDPPASADSLIQYNSRPVQLTSPTPTQNQLHLTKKEERSTSFITFTTHTVTDTGSTVSAEDSFTKSKFSVKEEPVLTITAPTVSMSDQIFVGGTYKQEPHINVSATAETSHNSILYQYADRSSHVSRTASTNSPNAQLHLSPGYLLSNVPNVTATIVPNVRITPDHDQVSAADEPPSNEHSTINQAAIQWQWDQPVPRLNFP